MKLYLMRHAHALTPSEAGVSKDALRPLSDRGRADARRMAAELSRRGGAPTLILHSPLTRAAQTAAETAAVLAPASGAVTFLPLDNLRPAEEVVAELLARTAKVDEVLAIGHQPQIGEVAALLSKSVFEITPATIVALELASPARVLWSLTPEALP
jgi:phosphohistidine phosphatase